MRFGCLPVATPNERRCLPADHSWQHSGRHNLDGRLTPRKLRRLMRRWKDLVSETRATAGNQRAQFFCYMAAVLCVGVVSPTSALSSLQCKTKRCQLLRDTAVYAPSLDAVTKRRNVGGHARQRRKAYRATSDLEVPTDRGLHTASPRSEVAPRAIKLDRLLGNAPGFDGGGNRGGAYRWCGKRGQEGGELRDLQQLRIGCKDDVLVVQLHLLREEVTGRIDEAY